MKVREIMTTDVATASPDTTVEEIAIMMRDEDTGAIPIVEDGELAGMVTDRDIVLRCIAEGRDPVETTAEEIVSENLETVEPDTEAEEAARRMAQRQIRRLPVVQNGRLVGIVSLGDLAVKTGDDETSGETLEKVSKGVKGTRRGKGKGEVRRGAAARETAIREAKEWEPDVPLSEGGGRQQRMREQAGRGRTPAVRERRTMERKKGNGTEVRHTESGGREQDMSARSAQEESARQRKVASSRTSTRESKSRRRAS